MRHPRAVDHASSMYQLGRKFVCTSVTLNRTLWHSYIYACSRMLELFPESRCRTNFSAAAINDAEQRKVAREVGH